ncbi:lipopolysaccharide assembly protein LapB [Bacteroides sp. 519]|uniref:tetratricopeptide repeat protein n=1 Tax=Bacteroides sp. 519 TaxID=2302937 RepID=UPI0013D2EABF|nr:tetratricopeptide repeat protein [Bacteroides sp. 519]NDV58737.1 tetratricopeptide repeat protein [Bacteroides sp. 519]
MKSQFLFIILVLFFSSCTHQKDEALLPELIRAESIMYQHPDSALTILEKMPMPVASNRLQHATWCLLLTQARYKNYIDESNDSLIDIAYQYFMEQDNPHRKALALYLEGALNEEWREAEKATQFYLDASKEIEKTEDYQLGHLIYSGLGNIYIYRQLYQYAEEAFIKSLDYAKLSGNNSYISAALSYLGRISASLKDWKKSVEYYKMSAEAARKTKNIRAINRALNELSSVYTRMGEYSHALEYIQKSLDLKMDQNMDLPQNLLTIGDLYRSIEKNDSAYYYLNKSLLTDNIYTKRSAYKALYYLSQKEKKYKEAIGYGDKFQFYSDSIHKIERGRALIEMQEKYNQEKVINEKNQLKIERDRVVRNSLILLIALLIIIALLIFVYQRKLIRKQRTIQKHQEEIKNYTLKIFANESQISRNENRISELMAEMEQNNDVQELLEEQQKAITEIQIQNEALNKENSELQKNVSLYSASLKEKLQELETLMVLSEENKCLRNREKFLCTHLLEYIKELNTLKKKPKYLDTIQWAEILRTMNWLFDNFAERLAKEFPQLTEDDIQLCCLIKLGIPVANIATIIAILPTSVSKRKLRLKERIMQGLGKPFGKNQTLDVWIQNY